MADIERFAWALLFAVAAGAAIGFYKYNADQPPACVPVAEVSQGGHWYDAPVVSSTWQQAPLVERQGEDTP